MARKGQVGTAGQISAVKPEAMTCLMQRPAHSHFRTRIPRLHLSHDRASGTDVYVISHD